MPLHVVVSPGNPVSIYQQIVDQVCAAVLSGRVAEDEMLPSVRTLAAELLINPNTVARAYAELSRAGIVESRPGRGIFVAPRRQMYTKTERVRRLAPALQAFVAEGMLLGFSPDEMIEQVEAKVRELSPTRTASRGGSR